MLCARAGAAAIAAALALSPTYAAAPKPIVDLSQSPAATGKPAQAPAKPAAESGTRIGPFDEQTAEIGGGAIVILALGAGAFAISRRKRHVDEAQWHEAEAMAPEEHDPLFDEPMFQDEPIMEAPPAADEQADGRRPGESWVERAYRGPSADNPSHSLKARLKRAAFFDKREREAAAGEAAPVDPDAGLPDAMADQREFEAA